MTAADTCRERGWVVGDVLVAGGEHVYELTALGYEAVLTRWIGRIDLATGSFTNPGDEPTGRRERVRMNAKNWTKATPEQLAAIRTPADRTRPAPGSVVMKDGSIWWDRVKVDVARSWELHDEEARRCC